LAAQPLSAEACIDTRVFSPSLALRVNGPPSARVGEQATFEIQVTNTGTEPLQGVVIRDRLPPGLEHPTERGSLLEQTLGGPLPPGATHTLPVQLLVRQPGRLCHTVEATARGGHTAVSSVCLDALDQPAPAVSSQPALEARIDGPQQGRVGDQLTYVMQIQNSGNVPLTRLRVMVTYEPSFYPREASKEFDLSALPRGQLIWNVAGLGPGEILRREVRYECLRQSQAAWTRLFVETAENVGLSRETTTEILPAPRAAAPPVAPSETAPAQAEPPQPKVTGQLKVSVGDSQDPLALNGKTTYIIVIENGMNVSDRNVAVTLQLPPGMSFVDLRGPVTARGMSNDRRTIQLTPIAEIRAGETLPAMYVDVTGVRIGKHVFKVQVDSYRSGKPIEVEEDTTVNISG
jgi:uncharacterized repeat protein (TIGR01451 family)